MEDIVQVDVPVVPLPKVEMKSDGPYSDAALYDPTWIYEKFEIDRFARKQPIQMYKMFPERDGECACGCGKPRNGWYKWHSKRCYRKAAIVWCIITGKIDETRLALAVYHRTVCKKCDVVMWFDEETGRYEGHIDHIVPVRAGGGGCWLNNLQLLCKKCHAEKTKEERKLYPPKKGKLRI